MEAKGITRANFAETVAASELKKGNFFKQDENYVYEVTEVLRVLEFGKEIIKIYAQTLDKKKLRVFIFRKDEEIKTFDLVTTMV